MSRHKRHHALNRRERRDRCPQVFIRRLMWALWRSYGFPGQPPFRPYNRQPATPLRWKVADP